MSMSTHKNWGYLTKGHSRSLDGFCAQNQWDVAEKLVQQQ